ncbi:MAG: chloride channel protein [Chlorobi bacterium]|nr:chloride channel protein [Chlorobiota bacterium]
MEPSEPDQSQPGFHSRPDRFLIFLRGLFPGSIPRSDSIILTTLALCVGVIAGFGAHLFHLLLEHTDELLRWSARAVGSGNGGWVVIAPVIGALAALGLIRLFARDDQSHGTSAVIESVALRGGRLPGRALLTKVVAAAVFIGSGGSAGPEDPSVQLGGVAGSKMGQLLRLSEQRTRTLVASGVAGAVAAAFNAPIAGVFFALEVVVGELQAALFPPVVLASVTASAVSRWLNGNTPAFTVPAYGLNSALLELPMYAVLGVLTAIIGVMFIRLVFGIEDLVAKFRLSRLVRGISVGLAVGLVGLWLPDVLGVGYGTVGNVLAGRMIDPLHISLLLFFKLTLTALCIAVIGVGGTFAPSLYLGAMAGSLVGMVAHMMFPGTPPAAYALVGMGGVLVAVVRAPITAVLLLFEITNDYRIILPIMLCVAVSNLIARMLSEESVYTERLARHGIRLRGGIDQNVMERMKVGEAMSKRFDTVNADVSIRTALDLMTAHHYYGLPVIDGDLLSGIITTSDIARALENGTSEETPVLAVATRDPLVAFPDQTLHDVIALFAVRDIRQVPVVERSNLHHVVGMLRRTDVMRSYYAGVVGSGEGEIVAAQNHHS